MSDATYELSLHCVIPGCGWTRSLPGRTWRQRNSAKSAARNHARSVHRVRDRELSVLYSAIWAVKEVRI